MGVRIILEKVLANVKADDDQRNPASASDSAAFDRDMTDIQNVNSQISSLAGALTSQGFASNAITLLNNYSTLTGVLDLATLAQNRSYCQDIQPTLHPGRLSADDLKSVNVTNLGNLSLWQVQNLKMEDLPKDSSLRDQVQKIQKALPALQDAAPAKDMPLCSAFQEQKIKDFWTSYNDEVNQIVHEIATDKLNPDKADSMRCDGRGGGTLLLQEPYGLNSNPNPDDHFANFAGCWLYELSAKLNELRGNLRIIDSETTSLYDQMNEWYFRSSVEQTDLLQPLTSNAFLRISIVVQRGYTPFTLANAGGTFTPIVTTNAIPTATTASTSTPAHAVKTILVEVHRMANFNLMGGVMLIHIPT